MTKEKADESALRRIGDRQRDDPHLAPFETPHDLEQLPDAVLEEHGELADGGVMPAACGGVVGPRSFSDTHRKRFSRVLNSLDPTAIDKIGATDKIAQRAANGRRFQHLNIWNRSISVNLVAPAIVGKIRMLATPP